MPPDSEYAATITKRVRWAFALIVFGFLVIFSRTVQITVVDRARILALRPYIDPGHAPPLPPPGDILDRDGKVLATSVQYISVCISPNRVRPEKRELVARVLAAQLGLDQAEVLAKLQQERCAYALIQPGVDPDAANAVDALRLDGVWLERSYRRVYPLGRVACQVLGFREKSASQRALAGVELSQQASLGSQRGGPTHAEYGDVTPVALTSIGLQAARPGSTLVLTIDARMQSEVEAVLSEAFRAWTPKTASATVMDASTGELLCVASLPGFDPNHFERVPPPEYGRFAALPATRAWEPGSICKIAIVAAALESGIITEDRHYTCHGTRQIGGWTIGCWGRYRYAGHGTLTPLGTLVHSCNMCASQISADIGSERLSQWLKELGLGRSTGSGLPGEADGDVPDGSEIGAVRLATMGYGQGLQVTDLQIAQLAGAIANGGNLIRPRIVKAVSDPATGQLTPTSPEVARRVLSPTTAHALLGMLEEVVRRGTGKQAAIAGVRIAGKTGTAEKVRKGHEQEGYAANAYISSFVGVLGVRRPRPIVIMVSLDEPKGGATGGQCAAPLFARLGEVVLRNLQRQEARPAATAGSA